MMKVKNISSMSYASALKAITNPVIETKGVNRKTQTKISEIVPTFLKKGPTDSIRFASTIKSRNTNITPIAPER